MKSKINILIFQDRGWWIAQCLEYDIAAQAKSLTDVQYEFQRIFIGRICTAKELNINPFDGVPSAPKEYHDMFEDAKKTLKVELKPIDDLGSYIPPAFMLPPEARLYAY